jgi:Holliday junction resolvasome RuvABC endonuclease subunit
MSAPILTLDIGFRATGWAVLAGGVPADSGCIRTKDDSKKRGVRKADADALACAEIARELWRIIRACGIRGIVCELPNAGAQGARPNRCMGMATAIVASVAELAGLPAEWVTPADVKAVAPGIRNPSKADVEAAVRSRWPDLVLPEAAADREHIADALGAYMAAEHGQMVRTLAPGGPV